MTAARFNAQQRTMHTKKLNKLTECVAKRIVFLKKIIKKVNFCMPENKMKNIAVFVYELTLEQPVIPNEIRRIISESVSKTDAEINSA